MSEGTKDDQTPDLRQLEQKIVQYLGKKKTTCGVDLIPREESSEDHETVRIRVEVHEEPGVIIENIARREWLQDVKPRGSLIEAIGDRVAEARKRLQGASV